MNKNSLPAFTTIELMVTIIIIGILASIAVPMLSGSIEDARGIRATANLRMIATAARTFWYDTGSAVFTFTELAGINTTYAIRIQDRDFGYSGTQDNANYIFQATRAGGTYDGHFININQDDAVSGDFPFMHN